MYSYLLIIFSAISFIASNSKSFSLVFFLTFKKHVILIHLGLFFPTIFNYAHNIAFKSHTMLRISVSHGSISLTVPIYLV